MKNYKSIGAILAAALILVAGNSASISAQGAKSAHLVSVPQGSKQKLVGVISKRDGDAFKMRDPSGSETIVLVTPGTKVSAHKKSDRYGVTYLMRGLRVQTQGVGDSQGRLVAEWVRFNEKDLRNAQAVEDTNELAEENAERLSAAEENARKLAAQIEETNAIAVKAAADAAAAQSTANQAFKDAAMANARINGLDDYDLIKTVPVLFAVGSSVLSPTARKGIDDTAAWAKSEKAKGNTNGWLVEVVGFADTTGKTAKNKALSDRRAKAVIDYLVLKHGMDMRRLVQPYGYGDNKPIASNKTANGRAQNRRVEIRILQNKGIANTVGSQ